MAHCGCGGSLLDQLDPRVLHGGAPGGGEELVREVGRAEVVSVADGRVAVAVLEAGDALAVVARIADVEGAAARALGAHRVVVAVGTRVQGGGSGALRVAVALALDAAVGAHEAEVAAAQVR